MFHTFEIKGSRYYLSGIAFRAAIYIYISMETGFGRLLERNGIRYNIRIEVSREGMLAEKTKKSDEKRIDSIAMIMASSWK